MDLERPDSRESSTQVELRWPQEAQSAEENQLPVAEGSSQPLGKSHIEEEAAAALPRLPPCDDGGDFACLLHSSEYNNFSRSR